jgi:D-tyrosyl-tRNA(Tyr) deacylase
MRAVVQRVTEASVNVAGEGVGRINVGLVVLLGVEKGDSVQDANYVVEKIAGLRVFPDDQGRMNLSVRDVSGGVLMISQFTLLGDVRRGRRPSFTDAAEPELADQLYEHCNHLLRLQGLNVATGVFRADMQVRLTNDGPVTILLDSRKLF